jgi:hypothetical protein
VPFVHDRAHNTPNLRALSYRFAVRCDDAALGAHIEAVLSSLRETDQHESQSDEAASGAGPGGGQPPHWYSLTASSARPGAVDVRRDDQLVESGLAPGVAVGWLVWDINRLAAELSGEHLLFHSGGLEASGVGILVPAASGSGKSTLTAGLVRSGLGYLSDELVALELAGPGSGSGPGRLLPYPKPITVKPGSFGVLADMAPAVLDGEGEVGDESDREWQVPVGEGTGRRVGVPCEPGFVVVPRYDPSAQTALVALSETEAFFTLALHAVNLLPHGPVGSEALGALAARCACYSLAFSDLDAACEKVLGLVGARV